MAQTDPIHVADADDAIKLLEMHPRFAELQVRMRYQMEELAKNSPAEARALGTKARMAYVLRIFDIRAEAFLPLVSDIQTQNAFVAVLAVAERIAWQEYTGAPVEIMRPASIEAESALHALYEKAQFWTKEGYKKTASLHETESASALGDVPLLDNSPTSQPIPRTDDASQVTPTAKRRGRRPNRERRLAIQGALCKHGEDWRERLNEIFTELDSKDVSMGDLWGCQIDLGGGQNQKACKWEDLDLAQGEQRRKIIDLLRKYMTD